MSRPLRKKKRQDQQRERREALLSAGLKVVARYGYTKASVSRITEAAGVAQGTLYSYFETHQNFLNELLPAEGMRFFRFLSENTPETEDFFEREKARFLAFSNFLRRNRHFLRVLTDAECAAPESYAKHMGNVEERYLDALYKAQEQNQIRPHEDREFLVIAEILSGAIGHIAVGFSGRPDHEIGPAGGVPSWATETYVKFIRSGIGTAAVPFDFTVSQGVTGLRPKSSGTRYQLLDAAARTVRENGFAGASVTAIAENAGLSVGTFYTHFASQQELFDQLLDHVRVAMLDHIRDFTHQSQSFVEREYRGFHAFFDYLETSPWYIRIESEAAVWAPETYSRHFFDLADSYVILLRRAKANGELSQFDDRELPVLSYIFMAARHYIAARYVPSDGEERRLPQYVSLTYLRFLQNGLGVQKPAF